MGTRPQPCTDPQRAGDEPQPAAAPSRGPFRGHPGHWRGTSPAEQREGCESQSACGERGLLTSRRVRKCNYPSEKEHELQFHFEN